MPRTYRYRVVDVFTQTPLEGNPLAVFPEATGLDAQTMQKIARELNLAETTFVFPPDRESCLRRVRIFTPVREMLFAGHPTIGTAWCLIDQGVAPRQGTFTLGENVGPISVHVDAQERIWLTTPPIHSIRTFEPDICALALGLSPADLVSGVTPELMSAGNPCLFIPLRNKELVDRASLGTEGSRTLGLSPQDPFCVFVFAPTPDGAYSRMFAPEHGIIEDPATGSATGPLAAYMKKNGIAPGNQFVSEQGTKMGRRSILYVSIEGDEVLVGGYVTPLVEARMTLPDPS